MKISQENAKKEAIAQQKIHQNLIGSLKSDTASNKIADVKTQVTQRNSIVVKRIPSTPSATHSMPSQKALHSKGKVSIIAETSPSERASLPAMAVKLPSFSHHA